MKHLFMVFFLFFIGFAMNGQKNITFINQQVENLEIQLVKKGEHLKLTTLQLEELSKIFNEKFERVQTVLAKYSVKSEVSKEMTKIEDEFTPKVESILTFNQRLALHNERKKPVKSSLE
jgi:deoxyribodipyrimidine photolyase